LEEYQQPSGCEEYFSHVHKSEKHIYIYIIREYMRKPIKLKHDI
jgi:hypothetical protein